MGIASSVKSADGLVGKILVAKRSFNDYNTRLGGTSWDVKVGTVVYALMEGTASTQGYYREQAKAIKVIFNGVPGEIPFGGQNNNEFDRNWSITDPDERLKDKTFVFTGALTNTREYYKTLVECFGGDFGSSVTQRTSYLVVGDSTFQGDENYKSTKAKKAAQLGIPVINEQGFLRLING